MALDPVKNFSKATVSTGYNASDTSIVLSSGHGAKLPQPSTDGAFNVTWWNSTDYPDPSDDPNVEIVRVTARSTDTLTVTRAQENTSGSTKNTGGKTYKMILGPTAKTITDVASSVQKIVNQTTHGFSVGNAIKSNGTANQYSKAQADSAANAEVVGIVSLVPDADNFVFTTGGEVTSGVPAVAAGTTLFLDPTTAGALTSTEPTTNGQVSKPLAVVVENGARMLVFNMRGMILQGGDSTSFRDWRFPDPPNVSGTTTIAVTVTSGSPYSVPSGKRLYIDSWKPQANSTTLQIGGVNTAFAGFATGWQDRSGGTGTTLSLHNPYIVEASVSISVDTASGGVISGWLVAAPTSSITVIKQAVTNASGYTVPSGKMFVLLNAYATYSGGVGYLQITPSGGSAKQIGTAIGSDSSGGGGWNISQPMFFYAGDKLDSDTASAFVSVHGYEITL